MTETPQVRAPDARGVRILHCDDDLVVVSKPSGMLMHRDEHFRDAEVVVQTVRDLLGGRFVFPVQRLDRSTSGIVALALSSTAAARLQRSLTDASSAKVYVALVRGHIAPEVDCDRPLSNAAGVALPSRTTFRRLAVLERCSLVSATLHSGRHHQIRRHLNHLGHHVLGDTTHGKGRDNRFWRAHRGLARLFLHAARLEFTHPTDGRPMTIRDPLPEALHDVLRATPGYDAAMSAAADAV